MSHLGGKSIIASIQRFCLRLLISPGLLDAGASVATVYPLIERARDSDHGDSISILPGGTRRKWKIVQNFRKRINDKIK